MAAQADSDTALAWARAQRADLERHHVAVERTLATPVPGRVSPWAAEVHDALVDLAATFERHIAATEGAHGLFGQVLAAAPRLEGAVDRLRLEHQELSVTLASGLRALRTLERDAREEAAGEVRERLTEALARLSRHRQGGADLVYEAYAVDIGVGD